MDPSSTGNLALGLSAWWAALEQGTLEALGTMRLEA